MNYLFSVSSNTNAENYSFVCMLDMLLNITNLYISLWVASTGQSNYDGWKIKGMPRWAQDFLKCWTFVLLFD